MDKSNVDQRHTKLSKLFESVTRGQTKLTTSRQALLFIEAICCQSEKASCAYKLTSNSDGLFSIQVCVRADLSIPFLNGPAVDLLRYFEDPELRAIDAGNVLKEILLNIVQPPFFWNSFISALRKGELLERAIHSCAWLLCELLLLLPWEDAQNYFVQAGDEDLLDRILNAQDPDTRSLGYKIKHVLATHAPGFRIDLDGGPGGRHDNDFQKIQDISVLPTGDELICTTPPFLRLADELHSNETDLSRAALHLDNQFRLLREDMIGELREEIQTVMMGASKNHKGIILDGLSLVGIDCVDTSDPNITPHRWQRWGLSFECSQTFQPLSAIAQDARAKFLEDRHGPGSKILRHQSLACLLVNNELIAFGTISRNVELLIKDPPTIIVQLDDAAISRALLKLGGKQSVKLLQVDFAVFAFEPILRRLQEMKQVPLADELFNWNLESAATMAKNAPLDLIARIEHSESGDLKDVLGTTKSVKLDDTQSQSLLAGLKQRVSLIQGPPGTGKSFIGALIAKGLFEATSQNIMVICYTNHALDQFAEDLMDIGIPADLMVRLGGQSSDRTKPLQLHNQKVVTLGGRQYWTDINMGKAVLSDLKGRLERAFARYNSRISKGQLMDFLEFAQEPLPFFDAFSVPDDGDGMNRVGKKGKSIGPHYLLDRWSHGHMDAGIFQDQLQASCKEVWQIQSDARSAIHSRWYSEMMKDNVNEIQTLGIAFNKKRDEIQDICNRRNMEIVKSKRIVCCTSTGAAMYSKLLQAASAKVLLVEEAGEILEAHVLTALSPGTEQLILIGDHQQLRPKINNHNLSIEKGLGYDLNRSLFERLIVRGFPHQTLQRQHRMRPEISSLIRFLTYPNLVDASKTKGRPGIRGLQQNVIFVNHREPELEIKGAKERLKQTGSSKQNKFEALMVLKCVKYLAQQGYGSEDIVVLTPYLGQLRMLQETLRTENDPILNDIDMHDLIQAGLISPDAPQSTSKRSVHLSSIDNYQGEEKSIVIVSMTRSNPENDIGFMSAPERLNVLLSRARDGLIMIGNLDTFTNARKGKDVWKKFAKYIQDEKRGHVYAGLPVRCQTHPDRKATLLRPEDFERVCPDGGCSQLCDSVLSCGVHKCPQRCHILSDHSKMLCEELLSFQCSKGHIQKWKCHSNAPFICRACERQDNQKKRKIERDFALQQQRDAEALIHNREIEDINIQIENARQRFADVQLRAERAAAIKQKRNDLQKATSASTSRGHQASGSMLVDVDRVNIVSETAASVSKQDGQHVACDTSGLEARPSTDCATSSPISHEVSSSRAEWDRQKQVNNASNDAIDGIMNLVGLEDVCTQVLRIKARIETMQRQNISLEKERFGVVFQGNPGTGKTTVARLYAQFLSSMGVLPGSDFVETSGAKLANEGLAGAKKHLDTILNAGGGVFFIDEAYQLTDKHHFGGSTVLDFLLTEIENLRGKVVFIFAGYVKPMEAFFAHNPGLPSRVPYSLVFADYSDAELVLMLGNMFQRRFDGRAQIEDGAGGLFARIVCRRLGRGRGREGFGNMRDLENIFARICERQANHLSRERRLGHSPNDYVFVREDMIGPDPSSAILKSNAWQKLQKLVGISDVKKSISVQFELIRTNYQRELQELEPVQMSLNRVFLGSPGTGKTSVAKLYGQILADLGLLSNGEVITKSPADFIGSALGQSEQNTKSILNSSIGKVLIIDEAYMLGPNDSSSGGSEPYRTAVIDTMVAEIQSVPGEDRCVLLLGYERQMLAMFQKVNQGLSRRFPLSDAFYFDDFNDAELRQILEHKLREQDLKATPDAISVAIDVLARARNKLNFGNGGDVESLISKAKVNLQHRMTSQGAAERSADFEFESHDFDPDFDRARNAGVNLRELFADVVGSEELVAQFELFQKMAQGMKAQGLDPLEQVPTTFIFKGPPGTGKTTTARKIGQIYFDLGFLSDVEVVECSASDLIAEYVGQTGPKTRRQLETGLGRVLFIDEAYRLSDGSFGTEAANELVDLLTKPEFMGKLIVILAGYEDDMNRLMSVNHGLSSRFPDVVNFRPLTASNCMELLSKILTQKKVAMPSLQVSGCQAYNKISQLFDRLASMRSWGNGRDVQTLAKKMIRSIFKREQSASSQMELTVDETLDCLEQELRERTKREEAAVTPSASFMSALPPALASTLAPANVPDIAIAQTTLKQDQATTEEMQSEAGQAEPDDLGRDPDISDEAWLQLQADKAAVQRELQQNERRMTEQQASSEAARDAHAKAEARVKELENQKVNNAAAAEWKRIVEKARIERAEAQAEKERQRKVLEEMIKKAQEEKRKEALAQAKLQRMGVCVAGYRWIKQASGYRCAGGAHFVSNGNLGLG